MVTNSRRWLLRERTATAHKSLDATVGALGSDTDYRRYLVGTAAFRFAIEPRLSDMSLAAGSTTRVTMIGDDIRKDLDDLGLAAPDPAPFDVPLSRDAALGVLYVVEGSALGAKLLRKNAAGLGFSADFGARHLARQTGSPDNWRAYLSLLDDAQPFDEETCVAAALSTFDAASRAYGIHVHA